MKRFLIKLAVHLRLYRYRCPRHNMVLVECGNLDSKDFKWCVACVASGRTPEIFKESELLDIMEGKR